MTRMTATEAARNFSEVLNRVGSGDEIEITRSGAPVAVISRPAIRMQPPERLAELLAAGPAVDDRFAEDLVKIRRAAGPPRDPWPS
jgi:prevent-host-death family protein